MTGQIDSDRDLQSLISKAVVPDDLLADSSEAIEEMLDGVFAVSFDDDELQRIVNKATGETPLRSDLESADVAELNGNHRRQPVNRDSTLLHRRPSVVSARPSGAVAVVLGVKPAVMSIVVDSGIRDGNTP